MMNKEKKIDIPLDICFNILSRLSARSLSRFLCVCKDWSSLIKDPIFMYSYLQQSEEKDGRQFFKFRQLSGYDKDRNSLYETMLYSVDKDGTTAQVLKTPIVHHKISVTCDGLLCYITPCKNVRVLNPITGKSMTLPKPDFLRFKKPNPVLGFGFDSIAKRYKVVAWENENDYLQVEIYTLGTNSWRKINRPPIITGKLFGARVDVNHSGCSSYRMDVATLGDQTHVYLNGASYWNCRISAAINDRIKHEYMYGREILSFDFAQEKFSVIPVPNEMDPFFLHAYWLRELEGRLCLVHKKYSSCYAGLHDEHDSMKLWLLINNGDDKPEWIGQSISLPSKLGKFVEGTAVVPLEKGKILMKTRYGWCQYRTVLCRYNEHGRAVNSIEAHEFPSYLGDIDHFHIGSPWRKEMLKSALNKM